VECRCNIAQDEAYFYTKDIVRWHVGVGDERFGVGDEGFGVGDEGFGVSDEGYGVDGEYELCKFGGTASQQNWQA
jgi:hypothetical protein